VDSLITRTSDIEEAFEAYQNSKQIMKGAGLNLRKWNSNCAALLERIKEHEYVLCNNDVVVSVMKSVTEEEESLAKSISGSLLKHFSSCSTS